jgi:hypothetical protein
MVSKYEARLELYKRGELEGELKKVFDELNRRGQLDIQQKKPKRKISERLINLATLLQTPAAAETLRKQMPDVGIKETAEDIATIAPYTIGMVPKIAPAVTGVSETTLGLLEGQKPKEAIKRGVTAAGTEAALGGFGKPIKIAKEIPVIGKVLEKGVLGLAGEKTGQASEKIGKKALDLLTRFATKEDKNILNIAKAKPLTTAIKQQDNASLAADISQIRNDLINKQEIEYKQAFDKLPQGLLNKKIQTQELAEYIFNPENNIDVIEIFNEIRTKRPKGVLFDEKILEDVFSGMPVTVDELRKTNSVIGGVLRDVDLRPDTKSRIRKIKKQIQGLMGTEKSIKEINNRYAKQAEQIELLEQNFMRKVLGRNKDTVLVGDESKINTFIADKQKGMKEKQRTKTFKDDILEKIDTELKLKGQQNLQNIYEANAVQRSIGESIAKETGIAQTIGPFGLIGLYKTLMGDPTVLASVLGIAGAKKGIQSEKAARKLLEFSQKSQQQDLINVPKSILETGSTIKRILSKTAGQQLARQQIERNPDGSITRESQNQIQGER